MEVKIKKGGKYEKNNIFPNLFGKEPNFIIY